MSDKKTAPYTIQSTTPDGYLVQDIEGKELLLPKTLCTKEFADNETVECYSFVHEGDTLASTLLPRIDIDEFEMLTLVHKTPFYAEMDRGLGSYYLRVPLREQAQSMIEGDDYLVFYHHDKETDKYFGSCKIESFLFDTEEADYSPGDKVKLQAFKFTPLGIKVIVDGEYEGLLYENEVFQDVEFGEKLDGFVKKNRSDNKLDVSLQPFGYRKIETNAQKILDILKDQDGILHLGDKSDPEAIAHILSMSKKTFKKAIGGLYKQGIIRIENKSIHLIQ